MTVSILSRSPHPPFTREDSNASFARKDSVAAYRAGNVHGIEGRGERGRRVISRVPFGIWTFVSPNSAPVSMRVFVEILSRKTVGLAWGRGSSLKGKTK